ncbi:MAG TPA: uroporphyrinogen-III C-methyltransferase, partial [Bacteroidetes bacterium]|nr:uroporphyrinogen-III C-methyltransferase [Bacteroidota bacterium]
MSRDTPETGTIYLVGAGPGHPGLITRLGHQLLQDCDAVVYDDLAPYELVAELPPNIVRYYVGKRAGRHSRPQKETNSLLISLAEKGLNVVRLKGGDPFIFGRGGEEVTRLKEAGVPFRIVPGVTAVTAVAAGAGIPLTDRRDAAWLLMATGHEAASASLPVPWEEIAALRGGTVVIYMGVGALPEIVKRLISGGAAPDTHAAVVVSGYTGAQRIVTAELADLPRSCAEQDVQPPALVILGDVVKRMDGVGWMQPGVLAGRRILITRPYEASAEICGILRK